MIASILTAAAVPDTPCTGLIGCGAAGSHIILNNMPALSTLLMIIAGSSAVFFIVLAGFRMVAALGDDGQIADQKRAVLNVLLGLGVVIISQAVVGFVGTQNYGQGSNPLDLFINLIGFGIFVLLNIFNATVVIAIIYGGMRMVYAQGKSDEFAKGKAIVTWSIGGAVVANLANALVQALATIFGV
jgi:hypothetical protein